MYISTYATAFGAKVQIRILLPEYFGIILLSYQKKKLKMNLKKCRKIKPFQTIFSSRLRSGFNGLAAKSLTRIMDERCICSYYSNLCSIAKVQIQTEGRYDTNKSGQCGTALLLSCF